MLFQLSGVGVVQVNHQTGRFVRASRAFCDMVGYSEAELQALTYPELIQSDDRARGDAAFGATREEKERGNPFVSRWSCKNGAVVWLELTIITVADGSEPYTVAIVYDVSERKRAEEALRISEERLRLALGTGQIFTWDTDLLTGRMVASDNAAHILGYAPSALPTTLREAEALILPEDLALTRRAVEQAAEDDTFEYEARIVGGRGETVWLQIQGVAVRDDEGRPVRHTGVSYNITERKLAELNTAFLADINAALAQLTATDEIVATVGEGLSQHLELTRCTFALIGEENRSATVIYDGIRGSASDALGVHALSSWVDDELWQNFIEGEVIAISDVTTHPSTKSLFGGWDAFGIGSCIIAPYVRDGIWTFALTGCRSRPTVWRADEIELLRDLSVLVYRRFERASAEAALRDSEARYRALFSALDEGFVTCEMLFDDLGKPYDGRFLEVNPAFERLTGLSGAVGKTMRDLVPNAERWWIEAFGNVALTGQPSRYENWTEVLGRWFDTYVFPIGEPGSRTVAMLFNDVTDRKRAEEALKNLNATLEQRVAARTEELRRSEARFTQAFQVGPVAASITTLEKETFLEINDTFSQLTGYARNEVVGRSVFELNIWSSKENQQKLTEAQRGGHGFRNLELKLRDNAGGLHDVLLSAEVIHFDGTDAYLKMFYDITARKRTEEQMTRAIQDVVSDTNWFSQRVMERLAYIQRGDAEEKEMVKLSTRERQLLELIAKGQNNKVIAKELDIAVPTVRNYLATVYSKLSVHSRAEAIVWARERGIVGS